MFKIRKSAILGFISENLRLIVIVSAIAIPAVFAIMGLSQHSAHAFSGSSHVFSQHTTQNSAHAFSGSFDSALPY
jgi:hypothetical protein